METFAEKIIAFNRSLEFTAPLPDGIAVMNPFHEHDHALEASSLFYQKYYSDQSYRYAILGINPGRFGAGLTGVPFTDPKRLKEACHIDVYTGPSAHEPSSVFVYDVIAAYGGVETFYSRFYINSLCPLGFTAPGKNGKQVNYNYYDSPALARAATPFIVETLPRQIAFNLHTAVCFCMGTGKNEKFLKQLNEKHQFFEKIVALEHPRYVIQYKSKEKNRYIDKYLRALEDVSLS